MSDRAPGITVRPADGATRIADVRFSPATREQERAGTFFPMQDVEVRVGRRPYDHQPVVRIRGDVTLDAPEWVAMSALADIEVTAEWETIDPGDQFSNDELVECPDDCPLGDEDGAVRCDVLDVWNIRRNIDAGNIWAWCSVTVTARWLGHSGSDSLGACSYASEQEFRAPGGYYDDMVKNALRELRDAIERSSK